MVLKKLNNSSDKCEVSDSWARMLGSHREARNCFLETGAKLFKQQSIYGVLKETAWVDHAGEFTILYGNYKDNYVLLRREEHSHYLHPCSGRDANETEVENQQSAIPI